MQSDEILAAIREIGRASEDFDDRTLWLVHPRRSDDAGTLKHVASIPKGGAMKTFWNALGRGLAKAALYCVEHPDQVIAIAQAAKALK